MTQADNKNVLIVGASGLVGTAAALAFTDAGWNVIAASRRSPELLADKPCTHLPIDLQDARACAEAVQSLTHITHVVYTAVYELPGLVQGWSDPQQIDTNDQMLRNLMDPLSQVAQLEHVTLLQGTKAYGASVAPMRVPARESQPRVEHANFYWRHEDHLHALAEQRGFSYTILRPQLIVGPNHGVVMNLPPVVGVYAAMRHHEGLPFSFPGGPDWVWEAVDVRLVGRACVWAATATAAQGETYNLTNGEVFMWRDMWPAIAQTLGVTSGPDEPFSVAHYLTERAALWSQITQQYNLQAIDLFDLLGESHHYADLCFACGAAQAPPPTFVSTVKIKQAGFTDTFNSEESFCYWLNDLVNRRVLPKFS
jgi:nucleoside-diphosphate-sugar epimerase